MTEGELELNARIEAYEVALAVFLNSSIDKEKFRLRFSALEEHARLNDGHPSFVAVLSSVRDRLTPG